MTFLESTWLGIKLGIVIGALQSLILYILINGG